jgi:hypothetical protein
VAGLVVRADGKVGFVIETGVGAADEPLRKRQRMRLRAWRA